MSVSKITYNGHGFFTTVNTVLVKMDKHEKITKTGIIIPDTAKKRTDFSGEIVAVSRGIAEDGEIKVGDRVVVEKQTKRTMPTDDNENEYRLYKVNEIKMYGI